MSFTEQEENELNSQWLLQMTDTRIEVETIETKPKSKCKSNKRK